MGRPVILLGPSFFDELGVAYTPTTIPVASELLRQDLTPKDRTGAAQFASYALKDGDTLKYIEDGSSFTAKDFRLARPMLGWIAPRPRTTLHVTPSAS